MSGKGRAGLAVLALLLAASAAWPLLSRTGDAPSCPFGRDVELATLTVCDRTLGGLWRSLALGVLAGAGSAAIALGLALVARARRGAVEQVIARAADVAFAIPDVLVLVLVAFAVKLVADARGLAPPAMGVMLGSLVLIGWAGPARMIHRRLASLEQADFVTAARAIGASRRRILVRELLPFAWDYVFAIFLLRVPAAILAESTVSFLGFGLPPDQASLGTYLGTNFAALLRGEWRIIGPAWALLLATVVAFQWTGAAALARAGRDR